MSTRSDREYYNGLVDILSDIEEEKGGPVHVIKVEKAKKVMKVYSVIGKIMLGIFGLALCAGFLAVLWWVFAENLIALFVILGVTILAFCLHLAVRYHNYHYEILEKAKKNGTIDD